MKVFDKEAAYYNLFHRDKNYRAEAKRLRAMFPKAKTVLEIGSGTGLMTHELTRLGFKVDCIEPSLSMALRHLPRNDKDVWKEIKNTRTFLTTIQDFIPEKKYDIVLALYDVLNYIPHDEYDMVIEKMGKLGRSKIVEMWYRHGGVRLFTIKRLKGITRIRLGIRVRNTAHLWYIFFGGGIVVSHHKLYFHI